MKAREFLAQNVDEKALGVRNLVKEPLTAAELKAMAGKAGGLRELVAPKKRKEAANVPDGELAAWLAADGSRVRRPIVLVAGQVILGFAAPGREALEAALRRS